MGTPCPTCGGRGVLPTPKICASETCGNQFVGRRADAIYCSVRCAKAQAQRQYRRRQGAP